MTEEKKVRKKVKPEHYPCPEVRCGSKMVVTTPGGGATCAECGRSGHVKDWLCIEMLRRRVTFQYELLCEFQGGEHRFDG